MVYATYIVRGNNIEEPVCNFVRDFHPTAYESSYSGGFLRVYEDYSLLNNNDILVCIRVDISKATDGMMIIEVISGGGSGGIIRGLTMGSESRRIKDFGKDLQRFCKEQKLELELDT